MSAKKGSTEDKFLKAAQENNQDVLLELFEEVSNVNVVDGDGRTGMASVTSLCFDLKCSTALGGHERYAFFIGYRHF